MPRLLRLPFRGLLFLLLLTMTIGCDDGLPPDPFANQREILVVDASSGLSSIDMRIARTNFLLLPISDLSDQEISGMQFIREEEKAAKDFLQSMSLIYDNPLIEQLYNSEQTHFEAAILGIQKYGLADPASGKARGNFTSPNIQAFYNRAIQDGELSIADAMTTVARLHEASHVTLFNQLNSVANNRDLRMVYHSLLTATRNHMRLMDRTLSGMGVTYAPMFISTSDYRDIITGAVEERSSRD